MHMLRVKEYSSIPPCIHLHYLLIADALVVIILDCVNLINTQEKRQSIHKTKTQRKSLKRAN